jgi:hypothetical protein
VKLILFVGYIQHFFGALTMIHCGNPVSHGEHTVEISVLPMYEPAYLCWLLCWHLCHQIFSSCNLGSINLILVGLSTSIWMQHLNCCLGRDGPLAWPPWSPDIIPVDFFLSGYVKDKVYAVKVTGVEDMKTWIRDVITTISRSMLAYTWEELEFWLDILYVTYGSHIEVHWVYENKTLCVYPSNKTTFTFFLAWYNF